jgi:hypothetical protein
MSCGEFRVGTPGKAMFRVSTALILAALLLVAAGCQEASKALLSHMSASSYLMMETSVAASNQRYIAERQKIEIFASESELQKSWESAVAFCGTIQREVISSSITARTGDSLPSGSVSLRVSPEDLKKLLVYVEKLGKAGEHTTEREDKTTAVVDTEGEIKDLISFRDNLRAMLSRPSATDSWESPSGNRIGVGSSRDGNDSVEGEFLDSIRLQGRCVSQHEASRASPLQGFQILVSYTSIMNPSKNAFSSV